MVRLLDLQLVALGSKPSFPSRRVRNGAQAPREALPGLQSEGETGPLLGGEGDGASGDDPLPAGQLGEYGGGGAGVGLGLLHSVSARRLH